VQTLFIMHKASVTFEDADGTATIAIFYFQLITLMFRDRAAHLAWPVVMDILAVMELGFVTNSERTCMVNLTFYQNYYFNILSTLIIVAVVYLVIIFLASLTSTKQVTKQSLLEHVRSQAIKKIYDRSLFLRLIACEYRPKTRRT